MAESPVDLGTLARRLEDALRGKSGSRAKADESTAQLETARDLPPTNSNAALDRERVRGDIADAQARPASPMHARDRRLFLHLGIPAALAVAVFSVGLGAFVSGSPHWGFGLSAPSILVLIALAVYLFDKQPKPFKPPYPFAALTTIAVLTWVFVGWQTWLWLRTSSPMVQGYTQGQLGQAAEQKVAEATVSLKAQLEDARQQITRLQQAQKNGGSAGELTEPSSAQSGPIEWAQDNQFLVTSGGGPTAQIHSVFIQGTSKSAVSIKEAYAVSGITGHKQAIMANAQYKGYFPVDKIDIPAGATVWLELLFNPPLSIRNFQDQWAKFHVTIIYSDGTSYERDYTESYVSQKLRQIFPDAYGPHVTPRDDK